MAKIGSLTVDLSLESASFIRGMRDSAQQTASSTSAMARSLDGLKRAFEGLITLAALKRIADFAKASLEAADRIADSAKAVGLSTNAYQAFQAATQEIGIESDKSAAALAKFNITVGQLRQGQGPLAQDLKATAPAFYEQLRAAQSTEQALDLFLKRLGEIPGSADRARLLQEAFGRGMTNLSGLVKDGAVNLAALEERYKALIIPPDAIQAADQLADSFERFGQAFKAGFTTGLARDLAGALGDDKQAMDDLNKAGEDTGFVVSRGLQFIAAGAAASYSAVTELSSGIADLAEKWRQAAEAKGLYLNAAEYRAAQTEAAGAGSSVPKNVLGPGDNLPTFTSVIERATEGQNNYGKAVGDVNAALAEQKRLISEGVAAYQASRSPLEQYDDSLKAIAAAQTAGRITAEEAAQAQQRASLTMAGAYISAARQITSTLAGAFQKNKAFAIANAMVNVAEGITQALKLPFPLNWGQVGAVTEAGVEQIAAIRSAAPGSGSVSKGSAGSGAGASGGGGGGGGGGPAPVPTAITLKLEGVSAGSTDKMRDLFATLNDGFRNGYKLNIAA